MASSFSHFIDLWQPSYHHYCYPNMIFINSNSFEHTQLVKIMHQHGYISYFSLNIGEDCYAIKPIDKEYDKIKIGDKIIYLIKDECLVYVQSRGFLVITNILDSDLNEIRPKLLSLKPEEELYYGYN